MIIPRGHFGHVVDQAPLRGQRRMASQRRLIDNDPFPLLRPRFQPRLPCGLQDRLRLGLGLRVAMPQPPPSNPQGRQQRPHPLPPQPRIKRVPRRCRGPQPGMVPRLPRPATDSLLHPYPRHRRQSRGAPRPRGTLHAWQPLAPPGLRVLTPLPPSRTTGTPSSSHECAFQTAQAGLKFQTGWRRGAVHQRCRVSSVPQKHFFNRRQRGPIRNPKTCCEGGGPMSCRRAWVVASSLEASDRQREDGVVCDQCSRTVYQ